MNPYIFRKEDIRGIVGRDWEPGDAYKIGRAFACFLRENGERQVLLGRDNRISSRPIHYHLVKGLLSAGMAVTDLGQTTTPQIYWARKFLKIKGGAMITGSHNPLEWNGLKLCYRGNTTIFGEDMERVKALSFENDDYFKKYSPSQLVTRLDTRKDYINNILQKLPSVRSDLKPKVVVDSGNAMAGQYIKDILLGLNCDIMTLHSRLDGTFPNHIPDPSRGENILELVHSVVANKADIGIAFDGDVDRINIIDETGFALWGDGVTAFLAKDILQNNSPAPVSKKIILNSQCSPAIEKAIASWGGEAVFVGTGHTLVSEQLLKQRAIMAGEYKGHIYFNDYYYGFDDALYASARAIVALRRFNTVKLSKIMAGVEFYFSTGEIAIPVADSKKFDLEREVERKLSERYQTSIYNGDVRVDFGDGSFGLARNSDTMPKFEVYAWAKDIQTLGKRRDYLVSLTQENLLNDYNAR